MISCKVLIVGAGPAGISTWLHLNQHAPDLALQSIIIDKSAFPRNKLCGGWLGAWCMDTLHHFNIELDIPFLTISQVEYKWGDDLFVHHDPDSFKIIERFEFDDLLASTAIHRGLQFNQNETFVESYNSNGRVIVRTDKNRYRTQILIGADGAFSKVRRSMLPNYKPTLIPTIVAYTDDDPKHHGKYFENKIVINFDAVKNGIHGYFWHSPCLLKGVPSVSHGFGGFPVQSRKNRIDLKRFFIGELEAMHIKSDPRYWRSYPIPLIQSDQPLSRPNVCLVGDAAGIEPAFGGGIHLALSYGELAALMIIDAFHKNDFSFADYNKRIAAHQMGQYIEKCTKLAKVLYGGRKNPLETMKDFHGSKHQRNILSLFLTN
jgi:flavin-dependent dehydrogenase